MELYLQFGYGMMSLSKELIGKWNRGTIILSPRDLEEKQINRFSTAITSLNGNTLLDPQFYNPRANHHRLTSHEYWPDDLVTGILSGGGALDNLLFRLRDLNAQALTTSYILPGLFCNRVDDDWLEVQKNIIQRSNLILKDKPQLATISLSGEALRFEEQVEFIINQAEQWDVDGFYIVPEHPNGSYLVDDPLWLTNLLHLCAGLKSQGKKIVVGYCSHQMLILASSRVDAIASGTWLNVRSFPPSKFQQAEEDSTSRRATWYYCPQSLSEYKLPFLDMGFNSGLLDLMRPDKALQSTYAEVLFSGAQPSTTNYQERTSFLHYLDCLNSQVNQSSKDTFEETVEAHYSLLESTRKIIKKLHSVGVRGQDRDFLEILDVNMSALQAFKNSRGFFMSRIW